MLLKRWSPLFDLEKEKFGAGPICVRQPGLPLQIWSEEIFRCIGDDISVYLDHDSSYIDTRCLAITRILVHLDTREGLVESYRLQLGDIIH